MKKLILDLDTGVDDALAISYALGSPEVELIGITGTNRTARSPRSARIQGSASCQYEGFLRGAAHFGIHSR